MSLQDLFYVWRKSGDTFRDMGGISSICACVWQSIGMRLIDNVQKEDVLVMTKKKKHEKSSEDVFIVNPDGLHIKTHG